MQKKILSSVLALFLVGSTSSAFAGGYWSSTDIDINKSLTVKDSFKDQSDDDLLDVDVKKSFNNNDNDLIDVDYKSTSHSNYDIDVTKKTDIDVNLQGNGVKGKFVVQQFGKGGAAGAGDVITVDNSINGSTINSFNHKDSYNTTKTSTYNKSYTSNVKDSGNHNSSYSNRTNVWIGVDVDASKTFKAKNSFNVNRLGGRPGMGPMPK